MEILVLSRDLNGAEEDMTFELKKDGKRILSLSSFCLKGTLDMCEVHRDVCRSGNFLLTESGSI